MKSPYIFYFLLIPAITLCSCILSSGGANTRQQKAGIIDPAKSVAVLELFTSQGCSSCPPADRLLGTYTSKENVIPVSYHVDYWDHLGWRDPYSSKFYTQRQYNYASALKADVYTPQLIINGQTEMVGGDAAKIASTVQEILNQQPEALLTIKNAKVADGNLDISFTASGRTDHSQLNVVLVEKKTITKINAGENGGATLTDYNIARNFKSISHVINGDNTASIEIPPSPDYHNLLLVLFLQQKDNDRIIAASESNLQ
jgi:hypothetical protein